MDRANVFEQMGRKDDGKYWKVMPSNGYYRKNVFDFYSSPK